MLVNRRTLLLSSLVFVAQFLLFWKYVMQRVDNTSTPPSSSLWDREQLTQSGPIQYKCVNTSVRNLRFPVCVYEGSEDSCISHSFADDQKYWEEYWVVRVLSWLEQDVRLGLVDVGANIGTYTLAAAHFCRQVVAVEPLLRHAARLNTALWLGNVSSRVTFLRTPISDKRELVTMKVNRKNQGISEAVDVS